MAPPWTRQQQILVAILPKISAFTSLVCSIWIIIEVMTHRGHYIDAGTASRGTRNGTSGGTTNNNTNKGRSKISHPYHRLLVAMCIYDIFENIFNFCSTWTIPTSVPSIRIWAIGNRTSCTIQGFFLQLGIAIPCYNTFLALYYMLVINLQYTEHTLVKIVEPTMHIIAAIVGFGTSIPLIPLGYYNDAQLWCWISQYPPGCLDSVTFGYPPQNTNPCTRGNYSWILRYSLYFGPLWVLMISATVFTLMVYYKVRSIDKRTVTYRKPEYSFVSSHSIVARAGRTNNNSQQFVISSIVESKQQQQQQPTTCNTTSTTAYHISSSIPSISEVIHEHETEHDENDNSDDDDDNDSDDYVDYNFLNSLEEMIDIFTYEQEEDDFLRGKQQHQQHQQQNGDDDDDDGPRRRRVAVRGSTTLQQQQQQNESTATNTSIERLKAFRNSLVSIRFSNANNNSHVHDNNTTTHNEIVNDNNQQQEHASRWTLWALRRRQQQQKQLNPRSVEVGNQAMLYLIALYLTHIWSTINRIYQQVTNGKRIFILTVIHSFFDPFQGTLNFVVYQRPRYMIVRRKYPQIGRIGAIIRILQFSFIQHQQQQKQQVQQQHQEQQQQQEQQRSEKQRKQQQKDKRREQMQKSASTRLNDDNNNNKGDINKIESACELSVLDSTIKKNDVDNNESFRTTQQQHSNGNHTNDNTNDNNNKNNLLSSIAEGNDKTSIIDTTDNNVQSVDDDECTSDSSVAIFKNDNEINQSHSETNTSETVMHRAVDDDNDIDTDTNESEMATNNDTDAAAIAAVAIDDTDTNKSEMATHDDTDAVAIAAVAIDDDNDGTNTSETVRNATVATNNSDISIQAD